MTNVFISYSRLDLGAAEGLREALIGRGYICYLDKHDILPGEPWSERLRHLIENADAILFLISPASSTSEVCAWEVAESVKLKKKILPVVIADVDHSRVPEQLRQLNFIFYRTEREAEPGLLDIIAALETNITWVREHTRLGEQAAYWVRKGNSSDLLLRGKALEVIEAWAKNEISNRQELSDLQIEYLEASQKARRFENQVRRRIQLALAILFVGILVVSAMSYFGVLEASYLRGKYNGYVNREKDRRLEVAQITTDCDDRCPDMVVIPAGKFLMGSPSEPSDVTKENETPQHSVRVDYSFLVSRFEVTYEHWDKCIEEGGCVYRPENMESHLLPRRWKRGNTAVVNVSWLDAQQFIAWISKRTGMRYRLLSEAEWEYAARAGSTSEYSFGDEPELLAEFGWYVANAGDGPSVVGEKKPNKFGLFDMHGNAEEWVQDCYSTTYEDVPDNGAAYEHASCASRVRRGGSWGNDRLSLRSASRQFDPPMARNHYMGFRLARDLSGSRK